MASENHPDLPAADRPKALSEPARYTTRALLLPDDDEAQGEAPDVAPAGDGASETHAEPEAFAPAAETPIDADQLRAALEAASAGSTEEPDDSPVAAESETWSASQPDAAAWSAPQTDAVMPEDLETSASDASTSADTEAPVREADDVPTADLAAEQSAEGEDLPFPRGGEGRGEGSVQTSAAPDAAHLEAQDEPVAETHAVAEAPDESVAETPSETDDVTDDVQGAFDEETDAGKADDAPAPDGFEGDLAVVPLALEDVGRETLMACLRTMMTSRRLDEKMLTLLKQGKGYFHIGSSGHEASQTALGRAFVGGHDAFCFYYRDLATALAVGMTPHEILRAHFGKAADPNGGGRQMPEHFGHKDLNILSTSSSVAAQYLPAVGFALAYERDARTAEAAGEPALDTPKAVYVSGGEGSTSQGAFHEALNWAAREALPVVFHVQDNKYAISVPVEEQTAGGSIWTMLGGYSGLARLRYDGTDLLASLAAAMAAIDHVRAGRGPVALHADVVRLLPHSSSDDHNKYREAESVAADRARDPIPSLVARLVEAGLATEEEVEAMRAEIHLEVDAIAREVEAEADPDPATATAHVYYEGPDDRAYEVEGATGDLVVMVDAVNHALDEEMERNDRVLVYGEDVGGAKGGVFTATRGLAAKYGTDRCFNSPLAEHSIIGSAVGLSAAGYMPVVEIQFADYVWPGMQPLRNQVASMRYRSNGAWACPMVIRMPCGGYIHGGLCHSQNVEAMFAHWPGLHVVMPSTAADAKGLLKTAIRGQDPVIFLEHKSLYRQGPVRSPEPGSDYLVPLGKARIAREGSDLTILTWGAIVYRALAAARALERDGVSVEVVDVRSMLPLDTETLLASACKTGRVLVAYEDHEFMGFGAEIAARISADAFGHLDAPVARVAGAFSSIPYADVLEKEVLPQDEDVLTAARSVLDY